MSAIHAVRRATLPWLDEDAWRETRNQGGGANGQAGIAYVEHGSDTPEQMSLCWTCPLPATWCVGGDEVVDWAPCPLVRVARGLPPFERPELDALWAARGMRYRDARGRATRQARELLRRLHAACMARHVEREARNIAARAVAQAVREARR